jgi:hypothetical protein
MWSQPVCHSTSRVSHTALVDVGVLQKLSLALSVPYCAVHYVIWVVSKPVRFTSLVHWRVATSCGIWLQNVVCDVKKLLVNIH